MLRLLTKALLALALHAPHATPTANAYQACIDGADEESLRAVARKGESWEDAGERLYGIAPSAWDADGLLPMCDDYQDGAP